MMTITDAGYVDSTGLSVDYPWPGLQSYTEADTDWFHGRDAEASELLRLIRREPLTVLFGQSGQGKTSLLQAGLFPRLRNNDLFPIYIRLDLDDEATDLLSQISAALSRECTRHQVEAPLLEPRKSLWEYFQHREHIFWSPRSRPLIPILVFDQFEEVFTLGRQNPSRRAACDALLAELGDLIENRCPASVRASIEARPELDTQYDNRREAVKVVLSFREDYLADFDILHDYIRARSRNRLRLTQMDGERMCGALLGAGGRLLDAAMAEQVVRRVTGEPDIALADIQVEPAILSLFCRKLNEQRIAANLSHFTPELLRSERTGQIIEQFYEDAFDGLSSQVRMFVEDSLLNVSGHRDSCALENALARPGVGSTAIQTLIDRRLLRREERGRRVRLELVHDVLAIPARSSRERRMQMEELAAAQKDAAQNQRRIRQLTLVIFTMVFLGVTISALGWMAWQKKREAEMLRAEAEGQRIEAEAQRTAVLASKSVADHALANVLIAKRAMEQALGQAIKAEAAAVAARNDAIKSRDMLNLANRDLAGKNQALETKDAAIAESNRVLNDPSLMEQRLVQLKGELKKQQLKEVAAAEQRRREQQSSVNRPSRNVPDEIELAAQKMSPEEPITDAERTLITNKLTAEKYTIPSKLQSQFPKLLLRILQTESMDARERQYWLDIFPSMTDEQVKRLFVILETERLKLIALEEKYQREIASLNEKHLVEWKEFQEKEGNIKKTKWEDQRKALDSELKKDTPEGYLAAAHLAEAMLETVKDNDSPTIIELRARTHKIIADCYDNADSKKYAKEIVQHQDLAVTFYASALSQNSAFSNFVATLGTRSWSTLLSASYADSLTYSSRALDLDSSQTWIRTNQAHALALLGRTNEARAIYAKYWNEPVAKDMSFGQSIMDDIRVLRERGLPEDKIRLIESLLPKAKGK